MGRVLARGVSEAGDIEAARWFFETSQDVFVIMRGDAITSVNPAWNAMTGFSSAETLGRSPLEFCHPDDLEPFAQVPWDEFEPATVTPIEHRLRTKDGAWLWVQAQIKRLADGAFVSVMKDVTREKAREEEMAQLNHSTALLRGASGLFAWRYNPETHKYTFDHDVLDTSREDLPEGAIRSSRDIAGEIHPDDVPMMDRAFRHTLKTGEYGLVEYRNLQSSGNWGYLRVAWRGIRRLESGRWEILGISQDVTELAQARDAAIRGEKAAHAAAEAKSQFLANMSHEIRTPMNGVLGVMHLLKNEPLTQEGRRMLEEALACGSMLSELLNDVMDFSKIEAGRLELTPAPTDVAGALEGVIGMMRPQADGRGLYLRGEVGPEVGWLNLDPVRLRQMLFNLIGNAVKFTVSGGVSVRMTATGQGAERRLRAEIQDTGVGIAGHAQATLFQRFSQGDGSATRQFGGTGLGLSITRALAELMGGEVGFRSKEGEGSTFWFEVAAPAALPAAEAPDGDGLWLEGLKVLVVEDNPTNRMIATKMLGNLGAVVETAEDGAQGVEAVRRGGFDIIFMDIQMPVMDGIAATRAIRAMAGPLGQLPILAMTANAMSHQREAYRAAGMNGLVAKPLSPAALLNELARVIGDAEAESARADVA